MSDLVSRQMPFLQYEYLLCCLALKFFCNARMTLTQLEYNHKLSFQYCSIQQPLYTVALKKKYHRIPFVIETDIDIDIIQQ